MTAHVDQNAREFRAYGFQRQTHAFARGDNAIGVIGCERRVVDFDIDRYDPVDLAARNQNFVERQHGFVLAAMPIVANGRLNQGALIVPAIPGQQILKAVNQLFGL